MKPTRSDCRMLCGALGIPHGDPHHYGEKRDFIGDIFGGSDPPPPPNYAPMAAASDHAADVGAELGREQLAESRRQYDLNREAADPVVKAQVALMDQTKTQGDEYYEYMKSRQRPVEDALNAEGMAAGSEAKQEEAASKAIADARQGTTAQQNQAIRQGLRYGYSPEKMASAVGKESIQAGLGMASAANAAREKERTTGFAKKLDVAGLYRGAPGASQGAYGLAINSGNSAVQNTMAPGQSLINGMSAANGTTMQGQGMKLQGLGNILSAQTSYANANQGGSDLGGLGSMIGAGVKAYQVFSCEDLKEDKQPIDTEKVLEKVEQEPVESWKYKDGIEDSSHHIGPYAGSMHAAFGDKVAPGGVGLDLVSANGINMAAIQGLAKKMRKLEGRVAGLALKKADSETSNGLI